MGAFIILMSIVFGNGYHMQKKYDLCKETKFSSEDCKLQKKMNKYKKAE